MRHVGPTRRELGVPTAFNLLGPLANPGRARYQLVGVGDGRVAENLATVLAASGAERAWVVHGDDGLDELVHDGAVPGVRVAARQRRGSQLRGGPGRAGPGESSSRRAQGRRPAR